MRISPDELALLKAEPERLFGLLYPEDETDLSSDRHLDIDKTWDAIHFMLNGAAPDECQPLYNVVLGGTEISDEDVGYGPARFLTPEEVKSVATSLSTITVTALLVSYDPEAFLAASIYPESWGTIEEEREYLGQHYSRLVTFFGKAADAGDAMLLYLN